MEKQRKKGEKIQGRRKKEGGVEKLRRMASAFKTEDYQTLKKEDQSH